MTFPIIAFLQLQREMAPGQAQCDCLSRAPVMPATNSDEEVLMTALQCKIMDDLAPCRELVGMANTDKLYQELITLILNNCIANKLISSLMLWEDTSLFGVS